MFERFRVLPDGSRAKVKYGIGEIRVLDDVTDGDVEVWDKLKLPPGIDALIDVTTLEKLGLRVDPKTGKLKKVELYLL